MTISISAESIAGPRIGTVSRTLREGWQVLLKSVLLLAGFLILEFRQCDSLFENFRHSRHRGGIEFEKVGNYFLDLFSAHRINIQLGLDCFG
jgi:hypothetical protein